MDFDTYTTPDAEVLLRAAASRRGRLSTEDRRALLTESAFAVGFIAVAGAVAIIASPFQPLKLSALLIACIAYVVAHHVEFPVGSAWSRPTQIVFIPMLFVLPTPDVPLVILAVKLLDLVPHLARREVSVIRVLGRIADCAWTLGPVLVLVVAGAQRFTWSDWPIYVLAFGAQIVFDLCSGLGRTWLVDRILPSQQIQMAWLYLSDACLTCAGLLVASSVLRRPGLLLLTLPIIALMGIFARERQERMDNTLELSSAYRGTAQLLGDVIEGDDEYTGIHSREVVELSLRVAERLGLDATTRQNVEFGALLHDVGKIRVPKTIIHKPGSLTHEEWTLMREHTVFGEEMLRRVGGTLSRVGTVVRHSHERYDGTGYPDGMAGDAIPIESRIVSACDAFNAMTTQRTYRAALPPAEAVAEMRRCAGTQFDPVVVLALLAELREQSPVTRPTGIELTPVEAALSS